MMVLLYLVIFHVLLLNSFNDVTVAKSDTERSTILSSIPLGGNKRKTADPWLNPDKLPPVELEEKCQDCRLTSKSIDDLIRRPRQMDNYGRVEDRIDLEKIKKLVCREYIEDKERERCREFYFSNVDVIKDWKRTKPQNSFHDYVCIQKLKFCCPRNSFGPKCRKCPKCSINEQCSGDGSRIGNGSCICKNGHTGPNCDACLPGYYPNEDVSLDTNEGLSFGKENNVTRQNCKPCHRSCLYCRREGSIGCEVCRSGFTWVPDHGCLDIDECIAHKGICGPNTFCVNTEGSYFCYECDRACDGCHGDGPDMCLRCAKNYKLENGHCTAPKATIISPYASYHRYAIYVGLSVSTYILLQNNVYMSGLVGLAVAMYIGFSEYMMAVNLPK